jgi:hypothetical protein
MTEVDRAVTVASRTPRRGAWWAVILLGVATVVHTWPLATDVAHLSRNDNSDTILNEWIVSWIAHQLPRDPLHLFDANIFHPERYTLAYTDPLIVVGLIGAPLRWLGASPVLTYNVLLLLGFFLTGLATYAVVVGWTGDRWAGVLAGTLLSFNAHVMTRLPHLQMIHAEGVPLALWALDRVITRSRRRDAFWLALFVIAITLTSGYTAIITLFGLLAALVIRAPEWAASRALSVLGRLGLAAVATVIVVVPVMWPYREVHAAQGLRRSLENVAGLSATPWSYLTTTARWHFDLWSHRIFEVVSYEVLFPGATAVALSVVAVALTRGGLQGARVRMCLAIAVVGFVMSLGPQTPVYGWAYRAFPPMEGLRAAARFGYLVLLAVALLAGLGLAAMRTRWGGRPWMPVAAAALIVVANLEALHVPIRYREYHGIPEIYQTIAHDPGEGAVVEVPFYDPRNAHLNAPYMLASTEHWKPLVNGYSGFRPPSYFRMAETMEAFPAPHTLDALRRIGVKYVMLHPRDFRRPERAREIIASLERLADVELVATDQRNRRLYRLRPTAPAAR